jgi:two-component system sensor histidine kinase PilS (NtrC family)
VTAFDVNRLLRLFAWARLGIAEVLLIIAPLLPSDLVPGTSIGILALPLFVVVVTSGGLLLLPPLTQPRRVAWLLCLLDVVLVTAVVAATGGPRSIYAFLYVLSVTAACVLLPRAGALAMAAAGSLLYTALVFARTIFPVTAFFEPPHETTALEVLTIFLNAGTFLVVAIVAGGLAEQYRTTRQELERQRHDLRDLQAFKAVILNSVGTGLIGLDREHHVTALNPAAEEITGRSATNAIGLPWDDLFGAAVPIVAIENAIAEHPRTPARHETTLTRRDGGVVPVRFTFSALRSGDGHRLGMIAICEDLSEIREMEARMRQADRLATVGRMAANIAHEIRNPLASMTGAIEALAGPVPGRDERDRLTQIVSRESERLNRIISNFLEYARPAPLTLEAVNVAEILDEILVLLEHRELPPSLKIVREFPAVVTARVDPQQVRQAVWNLCLNAVEAMPDGGELRVSAGLEDHRLHIVIRDTGDGIPSSDQPHVFEPFFSTKPGGSGLGLALVHRIVRDHGGDVSVRSGSGRGTSAVVVLPAAADTAVTR